MNFVFAYLILYISPILTSLIIRNNVASLLNFCVCVVPVLSVVPSSFVYMFVQNNDIEHIVRHAWYAMSFVVGAITIDWNYVRSNLQDDAVWNFILFCIFGTISLLYFTLSHVLEYYKFPIFTHHGDVSILPLTLVAIVTFYNNVPDEVFLLARTAPLLIIVAVAWSTIHLVAFLDFAKFSTTRHEQQGFKTVTFSAQVTASIFLILVEAKAQPVYFFFFAILSGIYMQLIRNIDDGMRFRKNSMYLLVIVVLVSLVSALLQFAIFVDSMQVGEAFLCIMTPVLVIGRITVYVIGNRWPMITAALISLATCAVFEVLNLPRFYLWIIISHFVIALFASFMRYEHTTLAIPQRPQNYEPQSCIVHNRFSALVNVFARLSSCTKCSKQFSPNTNWLQEELKNDAPGDLQGIWYMQDVTTNDYMVHISNVVSQGGKLNMKLRFARSPNIVAYTSKLFFGYETVKHSDVWYETSVYISILGFTLPFSTLWCYRESAMSFVRFQCNEKREIVYQYKLKRIAFLNNNCAITQTDAYTATMQRLNGKFFIWC